MTKSKNSCYLDANFLISFFLPKHPWHSKSKKKMFNLFEQKTNLLISCLALDETFDLICKIANKQSGSRKKKKHKDFHADYLAIVRIILKNPLIRIIQFNNLVQGVRNALDNISKYELEPRDAFHYALMQDYKVNCIVTNNKKDFGKIQGVKRISF